jgi:hypothetical protein
MKRICEWKLSTRFDIIQGNVTEKSADKNLGTHSGASGARQGLAGSPSAQDHRRHLEMHKAKTLQPGAENADAGVVFPGCRSASAPLTSSPAWP